MNNEINNMNEEEVPRDLGLLTFIKQFSCTVTYDESRDKLFSLELDVSSNTEDVNAYEVKEMLSEMIKDSFDEGVGNLIFMMKDVEEKEKR